MAEEKKDGDRDADRTVASTTPRRPRLRPARRAQRDVGPRFLNTESAATKLDTTATALRARLRRSARSENGQVIARLGMGVIGRKFGAKWLVAFSEETGADAT